MSNNNTIPSPEEWLKRNVSSHMRKCMEQGLEPVLSHQDVYLALAAYAAHVAALVHRNTRHRAIEILNEEVADYVENEDQMGTIIGDKAGHRIINIPLRAVYPAGEENREG